jgi:hypothetical protein
VPGIGGDQIAQVVAVLDRRQQLGPLRAHRHQVRPEIRAGRRQRPLVRHQRLLAGRRARVPEEDQHQRPGAEQPPQVDRPQIDLDERQVRHPAAGRDHPAPDRVLLELPPDRGLLGSPAGGFWRASGEKHGTRHGVTVSSQ